MGSSSWSPARPASARLASSGRSFGTGPGAGLRRQRGCGGAAGPRRAGLVDPRPGTLDDPASPRSPTLGSQLLELGKDVARGRARPAPAARDGDRRADPRPRCRAPRCSRSEDLQWADDLSLEIIAELARRSRDRPLLLTGDYRVEDVPRGTEPARTGGHGCSRSGSPRSSGWDRSTATETALVTTLILDTGLPAPREVAAAVYERTDGIPLHIEELLGALSAEARADGTAIREANVPDTIEDAILARLARLSPEAQATAGAGQSSGGASVPEVLAGIMDMPPGELDAPLQELVDQFVLDPPGLRGLVRLPHQLLRDALYRTIPNSERRRFHARAGEFGARLEGASEIHASVHYERAGLRREAFDAALAGARDAARLSAHREAFELYRTRRRQHPRTTSNRPFEHRSSSATPPRPRPTRRTNSRPRSLTRPSSRFRRGGQPVRAIEAFSTIATAWNREGRPGDPAAGSAARAVDASSKRCPMATRRPGRSRR